MISFNQRYKMNSDCGLPTHVVSSQMFKLKIMNRNNKQAGGNDKIDLEV